MTERGNEITMTERGNEITMTEGEMKWGKHTNKVGNKSTTT